MHHELSVSLALVSPSVSLLSSETEQLSVFHLSITESIGATDLSAVYLKHENQQKWIQTEVKLLISCLDHSEESLSAAG